MARTDNDSWEITESVGATALGVAAARAADTESDDPLISDPFARVFLDTVGDGVWNWFAAPELPAEVVDAEPALPLRMISKPDVWARSAVSTSSAIRASSRDSLGISTSAAVSSIGSPCKSSTGPILVGKTRAVT